RRERDGAVRLVQGSPGDRRPDPEAERPAASRPPRVPEHEPRDVLARVRPGLTGAALLIPARPTGPRADDQGPRTDDQGPMTEGQAPMTKGQGPMAPGGPFLGPWSLVPWPCSLGQSVQPSR